MGNSNDSFQIEPESADRLANMSEDDRQHLAEILVDTLKKEIEFESERYGG